MASIFNEEIWNFHIKNRLICMSFWYNLEVGDSAYFKLNGTPQWIKVNQVDSIQLDDGAYYKRLKFDEPQDYMFFADLEEVWIENIGSVHGPLFPNNPRKFSNEIPDSLILTCSFSNNRYVWKHASYSKCYTHKVLGVENQEISKLKVYPNPFSNKIQIENPGNGEFKLSIINSLGLIVRELKIGAHQKTIDLTGLEIGVYLFKMQNQKDIKIMKIIKER